MTPSAGGTVLVGPPVPPVKHFPTFRSCASGVCLCASSSRGCGPDRWSLVSRVVLRFCGARMLTVREDLRQYPTLAMSAKGPLAVFSVCQIT